MAWPRTTSRVALTVLAALAAAATAQPPLIAPNYYLSSLPELAEGVALTGELSLEDGQNFKDGSRVDLALLYAQPGQHLRLSLTSVDFDPVLTVYDDAGNLVDSNDDDLEGTGTDAALRLDSAEGGRYLVVVSGVSAFDLGAYTLAWGGAGAVDRSAARELSVPGTIASSLDGASSTLLGSGFSGPGEWFRFTLTDPLLVDISMTSPSFDPVLVLFDEAGAELGINDDGGTRGGLDARLTMLLDAGTYLVGAGGYQPGEGGDYQLDVQLYYPME